MAKSKWKNIFYNQKTINDSNKVISSNLIPLKMQNKEKKLKYFIWFRNSNIPRFFKNKRVCVHNGLRYHSFIVNKFMINHKFGEFAITKKLGEKIHKNSKKNANRR